LAREFESAGFDVVSGGTDKHLVLLDLRSVGISAWVAAWALDYAGIIVNRNTVPYDTGSSFYPSGLRLGTPAVTTRGMADSEMHTIAGHMISVIRASAAFPMPDEPEKRKLFLGSIHKKLKRNQVIIRTAAEILKLTRRFPVP
jgi:glycine/serine hydroxymethyltransferase